MRINIRETSLPATLHIPVRSINVKSALLSRITRREGLMKILFTFPTDLIVTYQKPYLATLAKHGPERHKLMSK